MMKPADAERITGYRVGGVSPFGQKRAAPTVLDADAAALPAAFVNAGQRGLQARLAPADLVRVLEATVAAISVDYGDSARIAQFLSHRRWERGTAPRRGRGGEGKPQARRVDRPAHD
jgi:hypothetical protein